MIRKEALAALRAYTALPMPVQGILELHGQRYQLGAAITNESNLDRILQRAEAESFCLRRLRVVRSIQASQPPVTFDAFEGSFVVRGKTVRLGRDIFVVGAVVVGEVPKELLGSHQLLLLADEDFVKCAAPQQVPFGVNTLAGDLVPGWNYVAALFDRRTPRAVVACPNGLFVLRSVDTPALTATVAAEVLKNLLEVEFMAQVSLRPRSLVRISRNCLLAAPEDYDVGGILQSLRAPRYPEEGYLTAVEGFLPSRSLLRTDGASLAYDVLRAALPVEATLKRQPLANWRRCSQSFEVSLELRLLPGQETPLITAFSMKLGSRGDTEANVVAKHAPFREPRPGESESSLRAALTELLRHAVARTLPSEPVSSQSSMNLASNTLGSELQQQLPLSELFAARREDGLVPVNVAIQLAQNVEHGELAELPSGEKVVVPAYASVNDSPRMAAYLGAFSALGLQGSFQSWESARKGGVYA